MGELIDYDLWRWTPHPEVWLLVAGALGVGVYVVRSLAPAAGEKVERRHKGFYLLAVALLWLAGDWPVHDISEDLLYSVHMVQHLLITLVVPPLLLLATPEWLARRVVDPAGPLARRLLRPLTVGVTFNVVVAITHIPWVVNTSTTNGVFHYTAHLALFVTAVAMWVPVCGPFGELRLAPLTKMFYLFAMSVLPTVPAGFLTFAQTPVYAAYDTPLRLWGVTVANDQQMAGLIMKIAGGLYLWTIIAAVFFRWAARQRAEGPAAPKPAETLTYSDVVAAFERAGEPPAEHREGQGTESP
ncbi:MAG: cytochrome c oxidase assembly protein [bacterium]|nr:cytochrome c oxidase assembly protein [bacterium]MCY3926298.1 cytochrome c oxidase assembly protein [bacterium]